MYKELDNYQRELLQKLEELQYTNRVCGSHPAVEEQINDTIVEFEEISEPGHLAKLVENGEVIV